MAPYHQIQLKSYYFLSSWNFAIHCGESGLLSAIRYASNVGN